MDKVIELLGEGFSLDAITTSVSLPGFIATMAIGLFCALLIYFTYRFFYPGIIYSSNFNLLLVLVALITTMIIMTISANIVLSLGMVGALSIVRFRAAIKDPLDVGFLFLSVGAGLTAGAGLYLIAVCGTLLILLVFVLMRLIKKERSNYLLIVSYASDKEEEVQKLLPASAKQLRNKSVADTTTELTMEITLKKGDASFLSALQAQEGVHNAMVVEYSGENAV